MLDAYKRALAKLLARSKDPRSIDKAVEIVNQAIIEYFKDVTGVEPENIEQALTLIGVNRGVYRRIMQAYEEGDTLTVIVRAYKLLEELESL